MATIGGNSSFRGQANASVYSGSVKKIKLTTYHEAYGLIGSAGIGKVYDGSVSTGYETKGWKMDLKKSYTSILCIYTTIYTSADVKTEKGTFNINSSVSKMTW